MKHSTEIIRYEDQKVQPWKNGKGITREISIDEEVPYRWRISSAILAESSDFSEFKGYERFLYLASGGPISLFHDGAPEGPEPKEHGVNLNEIYGFSGELKTRMIVHTPAIDVNIFYLRDKCEAKVTSQHVFSGETVLLANLESVSFAFCATGSFELESNSDESNVRIEKGDTVKLNFESSAQVRAICIENATLLCVSFIYK